MSGREATTLAVDVAEEAIGVLKGLFSWAVLMPISVIVGGKFLAQSFKLRVNSPQLFSIRIPPVIHVEARNAEVILGFAGFIITLLVIGLVAGRPAYEAFRQQFGIDPGQFNTLCVLSSFATVAWSAGLWVALAVLRPIRGSDDVLEQHEAIIERLAEEDGQP